MRIVAVLVAIVIALLTACREPHAKGPPPDELGVDYARVPSDVVRNYVAERMVPASVGLVAPEVLAREQAATVLLRIAPSPVTPAELEAALRRQLGRPAIGRSASVAMAPRMSASLVCDRPCTTTLLNPPADRAVDLSAGAEWRWAVTATRESGPELELTASLAAMMPVDGVDAYYSVGVYMERLRVQVSYGQQVGDVLSVASTHAAVLSGITATSAAVGAWLVRRRSRRRRAGF
ncbi:MAG TPA: hypothetical protein VMF13_03825 [Luteitalea sp.]|nr:hypothetical protein [Luteitalea sp.]